MLQFPINGAAAQVLAAIDIGSNTIKMTVARVERGHVDEFDWQSETVRLGQEIDRTGRLADDRIDAALGTLRRFTGIARGHGASRIIGVATEATRIAANGRDFLDVVERENGIELATISGEREAELTFLGLDGVIDLDGRLVVADIGGGSTEVILADGGAVTWSRSFPLGSGRLTDRFLHSDPPLAEQIVVCRRAALETMADVPFFSEPSRLVVVGGTGEYLARLIPDGRDATIDVVDQVLNRLATIASNDLAAELTVAQSRARVLPAGIAVARAIAERARPVYLESAKSGIRRGLLLAAAAGEI